MTEPADQPIFFVVDKDPSAVETLVGDLERRFQADFRVIGESSAYAGWSGWEGKRSAQPERGPRTRTAPR